MFNILKIFIKFVFIGTLYYTPANAQAINPLPQAEYERAVHLYGQLKCPVCKSQSLAASSSFLAEEMKRQIQEMIADGQSDAEITEHYVQRYGDWILLEPRTTGSAALAWIVPAAGIGMGALWLLVMLRRWSSSEPDIA